MNVGVEVALAGTISVHNLLERSCTFDITGRFAAAVGGGAVLDSVTVDIRVDKFSASSLEVDDAVVVEMITTIDMRCNG